MFHGTGLHTVQTHNRNAEVVLVCDDDSMRPGVPAWLRCPMLVVPASLARAHGQPVVADVSSAQRTVGRQLTLASKRWVRIRDALSADGWIDLQGPPRGASACVDLLETGTRVREMQGQAAGAAGAAAVTGLPDDTVMRMIMFSSPEEAARRALLLFLLTWDPLYGAVGVAPRTPGDVVVCGQWWPWRVAYQRVHWPHACSRADVGTFEHRFALSRPNMLDVGTWARTTCVPDCGRADAGILECLFGSEPLTHVG